MTHACRAIAPALPQAIARSATHYDFDFFDDDFRDRDFFAAFFFDVDFFADERFDDDLRADDFFFAGRFDADFFVADFFADFRGADFLDFFADDFFDRFGFGGAFPPARRASDRPMAIACLRLVTFLPLRPLLSVPRFRSCIARFTFLEAPLEYLRGIDVAPAGPQ